ncbi:hypothetical protein TGDOM2_401080 [Toxoplasma gondii GAB2-2007-GAL-DOM2]|uniref:Uncharacterized protein n=1 Tax=Toxoplasma gondii GAB2-2007-GAL-DOM2 TaxID=1130820 RepID=A0A086JIE8_TOXGO|nr:hypothetical protein TGDOM2_401080 [Toxoplasma gondii GAB2-2007-GAL-DOM2]
MVEAPHCPPPLSPPPDSAVLPPRAVSPRTACSPTRQTRAGSDAAAVGPLPTRERPRRRQGKETGGAPLPCSLWRRSRSAATPQLTRTSADSTELWRDASLGRDERETERGLEEN